MINVGDKAPEILGINEKGEEIRLSAYKGKKIVLYFYPKDSTSGCINVFEYLGVQYSATLYKVLMERRRKYHCSKAD